LRLTRLKASPHKVALGFAAGAAVSFTPLIGFHLILAVALAFLTRGSIVAAVLGTLVGNPLTFPVIFAASYWIGDRMKEVATGGLDEAIDINTRGLGEASEAEAEAAAEAMLDASEQVLEDGRLGVGLETIWPVFSTMLLGSIPLFILAYVGFYWLVRVTVKALSRSRAGAAARPGSARSGD
jgi:hypothetical protein